MIAVEVLLVGAAIAVIAPPPCGNYLLYVWFTLKRNIYWRTEVEATWKQEKQVLLGEV